MKLIITSILILASQIVFAQNNVADLNTPFVDGSVVYEHVGNASGQSKQVLFDNAHVWFIKHYNTLNNVEIDINNENTGRIVGTGAELIKFKAVLGMEVMSKVTFTVQIDCKDNKYRSRVYNIMIETPTEDHKRIIVSAEDLMYTILDNRSSILNPVVFNKNQSKKILQSVNTTINGVLASLNQTMVTKDDF